MLHSNKCAAQRRSVIDHTARQRASCRCDTKVRAAKFTGPFGDDGLAHAMVESIAAPVIQDELTEPNLASAVMPPPASLEQLPKITPPPELVQEQQAAPKSSPQPASDTPGAAATPPPSKKRLSRLQELQQARDDLKAKQQELLAKTEELREKEQTIAILQEELDIERVLRALLEKDKDKAEEIAKLATGLCSGAMIPP